VNWLLSLFRGMGRGITCPRCQMLGAEDRGPIKIVYDSGVKKKVGDLLGCPHCGLAFFTQDGAVRVFGHRKGSMDQHPLNITPERLQQRENEPARDADLPWRRG
jgi:hypothetical protein